MKIRLAAALLLLFVLTLVGCADSSDGPDSPPESEDTAITASEIVGGNPSIIAIIDRTKTENLPYDTAEEQFFEEDGKAYYFSGIYSQYVVVHYEDGSQEDIVTALNAGRAAIADLDKFEVDYIVKSLNAERAKPPGGAISQSEAEKIALAECKVNYDYIEAKFDTGNDTWEVGFWETHAKLAAQTVTMDAAGALLGIGYAE